MIDPPETVVKHLRFLHIQKTAGSTFNRILQRQYLGRQVFYWNEVADRQRFSQLSAQDRQKPTLFLGHGFLRTGYQEVDAAPTITFLREPIARVKSLCQHFFEGKPSYLRAHFQAQVFDLDAFLESGNIELANFQTRCLVEQPEQPLEALLSGRTSHEIVDIACNNLRDRLLSFGLTEYFDESLILFGIALNWFMPPVYYPRNQRNNQQLLSFQARHVEKIIELNHLDLELYGRAREFFIDQFQSHTTATTELRRLRRLNRVYQHWVNYLPAPEGLPRPLKMVIKALK
jgi:hypothetical protein